MEKGSAPLREKKFMFRDPGGGAHLVRATSSCRGV